MTELLTSVQAGAKIDRETVTIVIRNFKPSDLTVRMQRLVRPMLEPRDGSDYVAPTIEPVVLPAPDTAGINDSDVTVSFLCADPLSGVVACPPPVVVTTDGPGQVVQ